LLKIQVNLKPLGRIISRMPESAENTETIDPYQELVKEKSPYLFCDHCDFYPIEPVHGHFVCPSCKMPTKCCEGGPLEI
jgi:hypothetical protein